MSVLLPILFVSVPLILLVALYYLMYLCAKEKKVEFNAELKLETETSVKTEEVKTDELKADELKTVENDKANTSTKNIDNEESMENKKKLRDEEKYKMVKELLLKATTMQFPVDFVDSENTTNDSSSQEKKQKILNIQQFLKYVAQKNLQAK